MDNNFVYSQPVILRFGEGIANELSTIVKGYNFAKGVLICDKIFMENGVAKKLKDSTEELVAIYSDITANPLLSEVEKASNLMKEVQADFVVALGGGSCLDLAKFAASMVFSPFQVQEYFFKRKELERKHLPLIVLPTTSGTGSEVTSVSVCNDDETKAKQPLSHENFFPFMAIVDPLLTHSVPPFITAVTGLDAMSHALEAFWGANHQPICDMFAKKSLKLIFDNLEDAYEDGKNSIARSNMSLAALYAGLAFAPTRTAAVHACSYPLSINFDMSHGEACAFTLDFFLIENSKIDNRIKGLAMDLGFESVEIMAERIKEMKKKFKLKTSLTNQEKVNLLELTEDMVCHPLFDNNPKKFTAKELAEALKRLD